LIVRKLFIQIQKTIKMKITGIIIMIIGLALTVFTTFSYFTNEKVLDIGTVEITRSIPNYIQWSPFIGLAVMVIGAGFILGAKKNA
jgi:hypothetical protein